MNAPLRLAAVVAASAAALGCVAAASHNVISVNAADSSSTAAASRAGSPAPGRESDEDDYPCPFVAAPGYLEGGGGNSQVIQDDEHNYMGCGDGPNISLDHVDGDSVTFSLHGDRVRIREGSTERLGPYRVHVVDIRGQRVRFEMSDPD
jgi:hypothetical protein